MFNPDLIPTGLQAITPSDTANVALVGLYVGGTGNVTVVDGQGNTVLLTACPVGFVLTCQIRQVKATGTTATGLVGYVK